DRQNVDVAARDVEQVRLVRLLALVAYALAGHDRPESPREAVDRRSADAAARVGAGEDYRVHAAQRKHRDDWGAEEDGRRLLDDLEVALAPEALVDLDQPGAFNPLVHTLDLPRRSVGEVGVKPGRTEDNGCGCRAGGGQQAREVLYRRGDKRAPSHWRLGPRDGVLHVDDEHSRPVAEAHRP